MMAIWRSAPGAAVHRRRPVVPGRALAAGRDRDPERPAVRGGPRRPGRRRAGQPGQVHLPRRDEPRDPDADERDHRHERPDARYAADRRAARLRRDDPHVGRRAAPDHQRHPRLLEDRGRQGRTGPSAVRLRAMHRGRAGRRRAARRGQGPRARLHDRRRPAADDRRRPGPAAPDRHQPAVERDQVHRDRRGRADGRGPTASPDAGAHERPLGVHGRGPRHRDRHPAGPDRAAVPVVQPGRCVHLAAVRRHGPGPRHQPPPGGADGRLADRHERRGRRPGQHVPARDPRGRHGDGPRSGADRRRGPGRPARARRGRQRHEPPDPRQAAAALGDDRRGDRVAPGGARLGRAQGSRFDLAILDMHMPELDGISLATAIRASDGRRRRPRS